ncbi:hypothetical protein BDE02_02G116600 [Populus trichocarpa]|nr:hypothetical protein BDE02_02G116600 [Populus trichocarpa]
MAVATGRAFLIQPCFSSSLCSLPKNINKSSYGAAHVFCLPNQEALLAHQLWFMPNSDPHGFLGLILHHILELWQEILGLTHLALERIRKVVCEGRVGPCSLALPWLELREFFSQM